MSPPFKEHSIADKFEPRGEFESGVGKHALQFFGAHVFGILDFIRVRMKVDFSLDEENVVNCKPDKLAGVDFLGGLDGGKMGLDYSLSCSPHFPSLGAR